jgi:NitT/TauT family transport system substrate-binding protein
MIRLKRLLLISCSLVWVGLLLNLAFAQADTLTTVRFIPQWIPQAQFAGYYVAHDKGFYARQGLEVDILTGGPAKPASVLLRQGQAEFGTMFLATAMQKVAQGADLVNLAQIVQRSALMLVALKSQGIATPADLTGRKVGLWGREFQARPLAFFRKFGVIPLVIPQGTTMNLLLRGGVEAAAAMWYNEYYQLIMAGVNPDELTTFLLADHGLNFPEDGIYCRREFLEANPRAARGFALASLEGWRHALNHQEAALDVVMRYVEAANVSTTRVQQRWMLARMKDIIQPAGGPPLGLLREADYQEVAARLVEAELLQHIPPFDRFYHHEPTP